MYIVEKESGMSFGNAGVLGFGLNKLGYVATLCTTCRKRGDTENKQVCIDLHMTREQLVALKGNVEMAIETYKEDDKEEAEDRERMRDLIAPGRALV